jgi:hypothetical protein
MDADAYRSLKLAHALAVASASWFNKRAVLAGEQRRTVVGMVIPKRSANPWEKLWENLIPWGDVLPNENRIDRDPNAGA